MSEKQCPDRAIARYTWPGRDEQVICRAHGEQVLAVAEAIGMHLQLIPIENPENLRCHQKVRDE